MKTITVKNVPESNIEKFKKRIGLLFAGFQSIDIEVHDPQSKTRCLTVVVDGEIAANLVGEYSNERLVKAVGRCVLDHTDATIINANKPVKPEPEKLDREFEVYATAGSQRFRSHVLVAEVPMYGLMGEIKE